MPNPPPSFEQLLASIRACTLCAGELPDGVRPVLQADPRARILIAGQAPGASVHASGVPFDDPSGERLRAWMAVDSAQFYNPANFAILPMGFCYPGRGKSGDRPPLAICATSWRRQLLEALPNIQLTLLIGQYAQAWHLHPLQTNLTETVRSWRTLGKSTLPLPHPSPRNNIWLAKNPWFEQELLPVLRARVGTALNH